MWASAIRPSTSSSPNHRFVRVFGRRINCTYKCNSNNNNYNVRIVSTGIRRMATASRTMAGERRTKRNSTTTSIPWYRQIVDAIRSKPIEYATIPAVAAFVGISTNYMGVQMLFYPLEYTGSSWKRFESAPYGIFGWQGVVPARTEKMALRLVDIVTRDLLSLSEAFGKLDASILGQLLTDPVLEAVREECGTYWAMLLKPVLPFLLTRIVKNLQNEIEEVLDLPTMVLNAFVRDKVVLVELFQKVGRVELDFLVKSGLGFGFLLGLGQMALWVVKPKPWTLPIAGSLVGYITNWIAIKLLFEPAEPIHLGPHITLQGLFESRQKEVSEEFAHFMESRVLSSNMLLDALSNQNEQELYQFLRKQLPYPVPEKVIRAAIKAIKNVASSIPTNDNPTNTSNTKQNHHHYSEIHNYMKHHLDIEQTLATRLKKLSPKNFEDLLHPVFQEDEIILIMVGGILGALAGILQTRVTFRSVGTSTMKDKAKSVTLLMASMLSSAGFFILSEYSDIGILNDSDKNPATKPGSATAAIHYDAVIDKVPPKLRRHNTLIKIQDES